MVSRMSFYVLELYCKWWFYKLFIRHPLSIGTRYLQNICYILMMQNWIFDSELTYTQFFHTGCFYLFISFFLFYCSTFQMVRSKSKAPLSIEGSEIWHRLCWEIMDMFQDEGRWKKIFVFHDKLLNNLPGMKMWI